jgi:competence protein ComEC
LAVSGAHLQIIFMVLGFSLQRFKKPKTQRFYLIAVLLGIWAFAFITGWCASVLRAAIMYTVFLIGQSKGYYKLSWNQLGFSAFLLLLIDPNYLYDVGFQLSYAAIAGIAIASQFWTTDALTINKAYRYFLNTIIATIGATMGTAIISAFYFHQFPVWFLPANLVAVPLTAVLLPLTLLSIPLSFIGELLPFLSIVLNSFYSYLIEFMQMIASLPFAIVNHIYFDAWQCLGFNMVSALFLSYFLKPERITGIILASAGIFLTLYSGWQTWKFNQVEEVIVWHNPKAVLITYRQNGVTTALATDSIDSFMQQSLTNYAEGNFEFKKVKPAFKLKIEDHCFHYNKAPCDSNCYTITSSPFRKEGLNNKSILVYKYPQANFQGYQTAKSGAYKINLKDL